MQEKTILKAGMRQTGQKAGQELNRALSNKASDLPSRRDILKSSIHPLLTPGCLAPLLSRHVPVTKGEAGLSESISQ